MNLARFRATEVEELYVYASARNVNELSVKLRAAIEDSVEVDHVPWSSVGKCESDPFDLQAELREASSNQESCCIKVAVRRARGVSKDQLSDTMLASVSTVMDKYPSIPWFSILFEGEIDEANGLV